MTQKERFDQLMADHNMQQTELLRKIWSSLPEDERSTDGPYAFADDNKANFNKMIKGDRPFKASYIPIIERELQTTFLYIVTGETNGTEGKFRPHGLEYTASLDDYEAYRTLFNEVDADGRLVYQNWDEYEKNIIDYIIQYDSIEGWRFLIQEGYLRCGGLRIFGEYSNEDYFRFFNILFEHREYELCVKLFDPFGNYVSSSHMYRKANIYETNEFKQRMLSVMCKSDALLTKESVSCEDIHVPSELSMDEILFINPFLQSVLQEALTDIERYRETLNRLLDYGIHYNEEYLKWFDEHCGDTENRKRLEVLESGIVLLGGYKIGNMLTYGTINPNISDDVRSKLQTLQDQTNRLLNLVRELKNTGKTIIDGEFIWRPSSHNEMEYEMLRCCEQAGLGKVPRYYETKNDLDRLDYMRGAKLKDWEGKRECFPHMMDFLRQFHDTTRSQNGKVYVHGHMWGENVILDGSDVKGVINWKDCRVGDPYEDIVLLLLDWLRIGAIRGADASLFCQNILRGLDVYRADSEFRVQLVFRIQAEVTRRMEELKNRKNEHGYADDYIYLRNVEIFLELYGDQIGSMQEKI